MTPLRALFCVALLFLTRPVPGTAQNLVHQATPDTVQYVSVNTYLLYFVRGTDTLGSPVTTRTAESRKATATADDLMVWVRVDGMDGSPFRVEESYIIEPSGRLIAVGGKPLAEVVNARVDLLPRFPVPSSAVAAGLRWTDAVSVSRDQPYGPTFYEARREYQVQRVIDTLGTSVAEIVGQGHLRLRQGGWQDEARTHSWWQEVAGPVVDTVYFDARRGLVIASIAIMDLIGSGGAVGGPALTSGLRSSIRLSPE